ncbi:MAG TPA: N-acetylglutaminylglutamine synthetase, partial [Afifellaceae bacterium]|nr:N-acetylglutaminylglutamine synthetase [Afifellaceae bacterium]
MCPPPRKPADESRSGREQGSRDQYSHRLKRMRDHGLKPPIAKGREADETALKDFALNCGWGRLVFAQTFSDMADLAGALREEAPDRRDIAFYVRDPHVVLANAPQEVFLDPSHTYRLDLSTYRVSKRQPSGFFVRRLTSQADAIAINRIYASRDMVQVPPDFFWEKRDARS